MGVQLSRGVSGKTRKEKGIKRRPWYPLEAAVLNNSEEKKLKKETWRWKISSKKICQKYKDEILESVGYIMRRPSKRIITITT